MMARITRPGPCRRPVRTSSGGLSRIEVKAGSSAGGREGRLVLWVKGRRREGRRTLWVLREGFAGVLGLRTWASRACSTRRASDWGVDSHLCGGIVR